jgi:RNA polymerase sigma-70 factor (ECF subfamily)
MPALAAVPAPDPIRERLLQGDHRGALTLIAQHHAHSIGRLCMAMLGSQAEAEEALQDTLVAAHGAMAGFRGDGSVRAWLFGIARRVCARRLEARAVVTRRLRLVDQQPGATAPDLAVHEARQAQRVREALDRVTPSEREAVLLRYEGELSFREIGEALHIDEATARKRTSRGLERLRRFMGDDT